MPSLIDKARANPPQPVLRRVFGGDPDMDTTGWAILSGGFTRPSTGPAKVFAVQMGLLRPEPGKRRDLEQADAMVDAIARFWLPDCKQMDHMMGFHAFIEAQQVYPTPDEDPRTRVAKANDLLRCAQVTGALQAWVKRITNNDQRSVLPATWKGQQRKEQTVAMLVERLAAVPCIVYDRDEEHASCAGQDLAALPAKFNHALDALGIALYGLDHLASHPTG
jgi:hypothetical protein